MLLGVSPSERVDISGKSESDQKQSFVGALQNRFLKDFLKI